MARSKKRPKLDYATPASTKHTSSSAPEEPMHLGGRRSAMVACVLLCLVVVFAYAGGAWASALYRLLTDGSLLLAWLACATGLGAAVLIALPLGEDAKPGRLLHLVTSAALGIGLLSLATLGLGLTGWLNRGTACALLGIGALCGGLLLFTWRGRLARVPLSDASAGETPASQIRAWLNAPAGWSWLWLAAMPFLGMALVVAMMPPGLMWPDEPHWYDVVEYHLQIPREWYEIGRIVPLRHNAFSFFPFNVEMHYLLAMHLRGGPWAGMYLAQFMHLAMIALTVAAVYGFARRVSPTRAGATIAGVAVATIPWLTQLGSIAYNEGGLLLFGTLATGWTMLAVASPARRLGRFPVAGLMAGFACGCKLTAVPEVLVALGGLAPLGILLHRKAAARPYAKSADSDAGVPTPSPHSNVRKNIRMRDVAEARESLGTSDAEGASEVPIVLRLAGVAAFVLAGVLAFAPWLIRNQVWAGNPVFPEGASLIGHGHFSDTQVQRWHLAHSPRPDQRALSARLHAWAADVWSSWQYGYVLLPLGALVGAAALLPQVRRYSVARSADWTAAASTGDAIAVAAPPAFVATGRAADAGAAGFSGSHPPRSSSVDPARPNVLKHVRIAGLMLLGMFFALSVIWVGFTHLQGRFFILGVPLAGMMLAMGPWRARSGRIVVAALVLAAAGVGFARLHESLTGRPHAGELMTLIGFEDLSSIAVPQAFADEIVKGGPVTLVGDARAFVYTIPMSRLHYRTVFDIDGKPGESVIDAWAAGAPADATRLVDPNELRRFNQTYYGIPELPVEMRDAREPIVLPPGKVR